MDSFSVEFVLPDCTSSFAGICSLVARTGSGELVVMANHEGAVMDLPPQALLLRNEKGEETVVLVSSAVLTVKDNECVVIADAIVFAGSSNKEALERIRAEIKKSADGAGLLAEIAKGDLMFIDMVLKA
ncbi:hypothetical protein [Anaplasma phagocytophilum]|uniref:hypothetical protein n=1 Tax=Anaplasma phagocytophilum TaxID=948 RepID=UPI00201B1BEE